MTEHAIGIREQVGWFEEDSFDDQGSKTMTADGEIIGLDTLFTPNFSQNLQEIANNGSDDAELKSIEKGPLRYNFTLEFIPYNWKFLKYCTHGSVTNVDNTSYFEHTFTKTNEAKTFTIERAIRQEVDEVYQLHGCTIKNFRLEYKKGTGAKDSFIKVIAECVGIGKEAVSIATISPPTLDPFQNFMATFTYKGSTISKVNNFTLNVDNGINEDDSENASADLNRELGEPIPTTKRYNFSGNINQSDLTFAEDFTGEVVSGTHTLVFSRGTNDNATFTFTDITMSNAFGGTNFQGINTRDIAAIVRSLGIVAEDDDGTY